MLCVCVCIDGMDGWKDQAHSCDMEIWGEGEGEGEGEGDKTVNTEKRIIVKRHAKQYKSIWG